MIDSNPSKSSCSIVSKIIIKLKQVLFSGSADYWERRYISGGTSGHGSYGRLAEFKAEVVNNFIREHEVNSIIELGCGDGNQLKLAKYPDYIGLDISAKAVAMCKEQFYGDKRKKFFLHDSSFDDKGIKYEMDLALSLDVIYHLVEDHVYHAYLENLFKYSRKYVILYASDKDEPGQFYERHVRHRNFTKDIKELYPNWTLSKKIKNKYPSMGSANETSFADFFIYEAD